MRAASFPFHPRRIKPGPATSFFPSAHRPLNSFAATAPSLHPPRASRCAQLPSPLHPCRIKPGPATPSFPPATTPQLFRRYCSPTSILPAPPDARSSFPPSTPAAYSQASHLPLPLRPPPSNSFAATAPCPHPPPRLPVRAASFPLHPYRKEEKPHSPPILSPLLLPAPSSSHLPVRAAPFHFLLSRKEERPHSPPTLSPLLLPTSILRAPPGARSFLPLPPLPHKARPRTSLLPTGHHPPTLSPLLLPASILPAPPGARSFLPLRPSLQRKNGDRRRRAVPAFPVFLKRAYLPAASTSPSPMM